MNTARFQLRLIISWKAVLLVLGGLPVIMAVIFGGIIYYDGQHILGVTGLMAGFVLIFFGGGYGLKQLAKKTCSYTACVAVGDKKILVETSNGTIREALYSDILSYRYEAFNSGYELLIKLLNGNVQRLNTSGQLLSAADIAAFTAMVLAFETAVAECWQRQGETAPVLREKTFFEKPLATFFLFVYAGMVVLTIGMMVVKHKFMPTALSSFGLFITYAGAWYAARRKQQNG